MVKVKKVWLTKSAVWIETVDGRKACEKFSDYPRLKNASDAERAGFDQDDFGLHWLLLDEDLKFDEFLKDKNENLLFRLFIEHPELNASAVARRIGISQSLFAQYVSGTKMPSAERLQKILATIQQIGRELITVGA